MQIDKKSAAADFDLIHKIIHRQKSNDGLLKYIFLSIASANTLKICLDALSYVFFSDLTTIANVQSAGLLLISLFLFLLLLRITGKEFRDTNPYYVSMLSYFFIIVSFLPIAMFLTRVSMLFFSEADSLNHLLYILALMKSFMETILFSLALLIVGSITNRDLLKFVSSCFIIVCFLILFVSDGTLSFEIFDFSIMIAYVDLFAAAINSLGYLILWFILKERGKKTSGNQ